VIQFVQFRGEVPIDNCAQIAKSSPLRLAEEIRRCEKGGVQRAVRQETARGRISIDDGPGIAAGDDRLVNGGEDTCGICKTREYVQAIKPVDAARVMSAG